jgi:hypothetical protein
MPCQRGSSDKLHDKTSAQGAPKAINRTGTRFLSAAAAAGDPGTPSSAASGDDVAARTAAGDNAYSVLATPTFTPGADESPFITWGDLEGTPLRLDPADDIDVDPAAGQGPQFRVPEVRCASSLHENITVQHF